MNKKTLVHYQAELWPAVCAAQGWDPRDAEARRDARAHVWEAIGEEDRGDAMPWDAASTTALFTYLRHLADPNHLGKSQEWDDCRANYRAFNKSRVADHWQRRAYGSTKGGGKLIRNRFAGRPTAASKPFTIDGDPLAEREASQRLMTMRCRARAKAKSTPEVSTLVAAGHKPLEDDLIPF